MVTVLHERGRIERVYADETRPLLQGARLTAYELAALGVDHRVVVDGAAPSLIARRLVDGVVVGADRIAANGDVANKVGTYPLALAAARAGVPFVVAAPESTVDSVPPTGDAIEIEERDPAEVAPGPAYNPAFDVTPHDLVTAVVTERRTVRCPKETPCDQARRGCGAAVRRQRRGAPAGSGGHRGGRTDHPRRSGGRAGRVTPESTPDGAAGEVRWVGGLLLPGLINAHCHSPMTLLRGQGEGLPLDRWLREVIWPREARIGAEDVYWGMTLASAELLRYGVTTTVEMYFHDDALAAAVDAAGGRCVVTPGVVVAPGWERFGTWSERIEWIAGLRSRYADHPRIEVGFGPHSAYALPDEALRAVGDAARATGAPVHVHLAETEHEGDEVSARHGGASVPRVLADLGLFDVPRVLAAHGVWLSPEDVKLLAASGVAVAHCPGSNAKLASGTAGVSELLRAGVPVGLGTDGPASNNDLDLWEEMRLAALTGPAA